MQDTEQMDQRKVWLSWSPILVGVLALFVPTFYDLFNTVWSSDEQGHGPIVFAISIWLLWRQRAVFVEGLEGSRKGSVLTGGGLLILSMALYFLGRTQDYLFMEVGSVVVLLCAVVILFFGAQALKKIWFPLFFMFFMIPLPNVVVDLITQPMKMAVSYAAENILFAFGYPIARTGVTLQIGPYQLLVADACAGLHTLFTLEALGLLYLNLVRYASAIRNISMAILIVPISFAANVIRVIVLTLVTYYLGDEAGQGFLHGFAGMVLFMSALMLIIAMDSILRAVIRFFKLSE